MRESFYEENPPDGEPDPESVFEEVGVSRKEIDRWNAVLTKKNYKDLEENAIHNHPRSGNLVEFFKGETGNGGFCPNSINNPLNLIRPKTLQSLAGYCEINGEKTPDFEYPREHEKKERQNEENYMKLVATFEKINYYLLNGLNEEDVEVRKKSLEKHLDDYFKYDPTNKRLGLFFDVKEASKADSAPAWLLYSVLNIITSGSHDIAVTGRIRALELLDIYKNEDILKSFRSEEYFNKKVNGFDNAHRIVWPHFFNEEEKRGPVLNKSWKNNEFIEQIIIKNDKGQIDPQKTADMAIGKYPHEAINVALLFLHDYDTTESGLAILKSIAKQDEKQIGAIFRIDGVTPARRKTSFGDDASGNIDEQEDGKKENIDVNALLEELRRKNKEIREWEEREERRDRQVVRYDANLKAAERKISELEVRIGQKNENISTLKQANARLLKEKQRTGGSEDLLNRLDPKKYYQRLGLNPMVLRDVDDDLLGKIIKSAYRNMAMNFHSDRPGRNGDEEKMKDINEAGQFLDDKDKRRRYNNAW